MLVGSAVLPEVTRVGFIGCMSTLDVTPSDWVVPDWWRLDACRAAGFVTPYTFLRLTNPLVNTSVSYNGGQEVPVRNRTWGAIKALYR